MPPVFKVIVSIIVWVLFVKGCIATLVGCSTVGVSIMTGRGAPLMGVAISAVGVVALILAAVAAKIRQMLE